MTYVARILTDRGFLADDHSRAEHALSFAQSVLPDSVSEQNIIGMLSESDLAPSRPVDGFALEETVQGVTTAMDCLSSWTTALELFQYEKTNGIEMDDKSGFCDELKKLMVEDEAAPTTVLQASHSPFDHSTQQQPIDPTNELEPLREAMMGMMWREKNLRERVTETAPKNSAVNGTLHDLKSTARHKKNFEMITKWFYLLDDV